MHEEADTLLGDVAFDVAGKSVAPGVSQQLRYLWRSSFSLARSHESAARSLSHTLSLQLVQLASKHKIVLASQVKDRLCSGCSAVQVPSLTCKVRLRSRSLHSRVNRKQAGTPTVSVSTTASQAPRKLKNEIVSVCSLCSHTARKGGSQRKLTRRSSPALSALVGSNAAPVKAPTTALAAPAKKAFSFLGAKTGRSPGGGGANSDNGLLGDFVSLGPTFQVQGQGQGQGQVQGVKRVSLIDLERERKKSKKKGFSDAGPRGPAPPAPRPPPPPAARPSSLSAIAGLFAKK